MGTFGIIAVVIFVFVFAIAMIVTFAKKGNKYFEENKKKGTAIIKGYNSQSTERFTVFDVELQGEDSNALHNLKGGYNVKSFDGTIDKKFPWFNNGDEVKVEYTQKKILGFRYYEVRLDEDYYSDNGYDGYRNYKKGKRE